MEKERKITAPEGCKIEKVKLVDGVAVVTFQEKERKLPKTWEEFCEMNPDVEGTFLINDYSDIYEYTTLEERNPEYDKNLLPDQATAEAVLALCQLIQLRNCYNGDWTPDWEDDNEAKYVIEFFITDALVSQRSDYPEILHFRTEDLCEKFLRNFRPLIEKLKPLFGIKEGVEQ